MQCMTVLIKLNGFILTWSELQPNMTLYIRRELQGKSRRVLAELLWQDSLTVRPTGSSIYSACHFSHCLAFVGPLIPHAKTAQNDRLYFFIDLNQQDFNL